MRENTMFVTKQERKPFKLEVHWNTALSRLDEEKYQKPMTQEDRGKLKLLANYLGPQVYEVIDWAVKNWQEFALDAKYDKGLPCYPQQPHIGFLLKYHDVAVNLMQPTADVEAKELSQPNEPK